MKTDNPTQEKQLFEGLSLLEAKVRAARIEERKLVLSEIGKPGSGGLRLNTFKEGYKSGESDTKEELRQKTLKRIESLSVPVEELEK